MTVVSTGGTAPPRTFANGQQDTPWQRDGQRLRHLPQRPAGVFAEIKEAKEVAGKSVIVGPTPTRKDNGLAVAAQAALTPAGLPKK
jgi:hypothetical protein